jgi:hypothetical protein
MQREVIVAQKEANAKKKATKRHTMQEDQKIKNKMKPKREFKPLYRTTMQHTRVEVDTF